MTSDRKKPGVAFWATVVVVVVLAIAGYPLSAGPVLWSVTKVPRPVAEAIVVAHYYFYAPLFWLCDEFDGFGKLMSWYAELWIG